MIMGQLFVFSAPSGTGKSTIVRELRRTVPLLGYSVSHTTRKPRKNEKDGVDYHFVGTDAFKRLIDSGNFLEWAEVYGNYYGTSFSSLDVQLSRGLDVLMDLDPRGAEKVKYRYADSVLIYVLPPSLEVLEKRLRERGTEDNAVMRIRLEKALNDIRNCTWYDYNFINEVLEKAVADAQAIITAERCRSVRQAGKVQALFDLS